MRKRLIYSLVLTLLLTTILALVPGTSSGATAPIAPQAPEVSPLNPGCPPIDRNFSFHKQAWSDSYGRGYGYSEIIDSCRHHHPGWIYEAAKYKSSHNFAAWHVYGDNAGPATIRIYSEWVFTALDGSLTISVPPSIETSVDKKTWTDEFTRYNPPKDGNDDCTAVIDYYNMNAQGLFLLSTSHQMTGTFTFPDMQVTVMTGLAYEGFVP